MVLPGSSGDTPLPKLTAKLKLRQRTGFFDSFETPQKRVARQQLFKGSAVRQRTKSVFQLAKEAAQRAKVRQAREKNIRASEDQRLESVKRTPGLLDFGVRMAQGFDTARIKRDEREAQQQRSDIAAASEKFSKFEQENQPLTVQGAEDVLQDKVVAKRRLETQLKRQAARPAKIPIPFKTTLGLIKPPKNNIEALERLNLSKENRDEILREISRRGDKNVTTLDVYRFAGNVTGGRKPGLDQGQYAQTEYLFEGLTIADRTPLTTTMDPNFEEIPLTLSATTARGRLLADWQRKWNEAGYAPKVAERNAALAFDEQMKELEPRFREELQEQGFSEEDIETNIDSYMEMQLRGVELHEQAIREWQDQENTKQLPDDETTEKIAAQAQAAMVEEFENFLTLFTFEPESILDRAKNTFEGVPVLEGVPRMAIGLLEILDAITKPLALTTSTLELVGKIPIVGIVPRQGAAALRPLAQLESLAPRPFELLRGERERRRRNRGALSIGGLPLLGTNFNTALPDLFTGLDDYFGGGVETVKPIVKIGLQEGVAPMAERTILELEEIGESLGFDTRGKVSKPVRNAIASDLAIDITAEIINPAAILVAFPFVSYGLRAGMGVRAAATQITANLLFTGMEPKAIPLFLRWSTLAAKIGPRAALSRVPRAIRGTKAFELIMQNLRAEGGGIRLSPEGVRLTEGGERMLFLADTGKKLNRKELLKQAKANGIGPGNRLQRMSNAQIIEELRAGKTMMERIARMAKQIKGGTTLGQKSRRFIEQVLADPKASLGKLRTAAKRAGVDIALLLKRPAQLTATETTELGKLRALRRGVGVTEPLTTKTRKALELEKRTLKNEVQDAVGFEEAAERAKSGAISTADEGADVRIAEIDKALQKGFVTVDAQAARLEELEAMLARATAPTRDERALLRRELTGALQPRGVEVAAAERAISVGPSSIPGIVPGRLAQVAPASVLRVLRQMLAGQPADEAGKALRKLIEQEIAKTGRVAQDLYDTGDWRILGREMFEEANEASLRTAADEARFAVEEAGESALTSRGFEEATRALRYSSDDMTSLKAIAKEASDPPGQGAGGGGIGRPPVTEASTPPLPERSGPLGRLPLIKSLREFRIDFEHLNTNMAAGLAHIAGKFPPSRYMIEFVNKSPFFQGTVGHTMGAFLGKAQANNALHASLNVTMRRAEKGLFKFVNNVDNGLKSIKDSTNIFITPEYLIQHPEDVVTSAGKALSSKQRGFVDDIRSLLKQQADYEFDVYSHAEFKKAFIELDDKQKTKIRKQLFDELGIEQDQFFHREVLAVEGKQLDEAMKKTLVESRGASLDWSRGFQKDRQFTTMFEGIQNGVTYGDGITENVMARIRAGQSSSLDKEVLSYLTEAGQRGTISELINATRAGGQQGGIVNALATFNNISRPMVTNIDLGFMGLQLIPAFARSPVAAIRGGIMAIKEIATNPQAMARYISHNLEYGPKGKISEVGGVSWMEDFFNNGGIWNQNEFSFEFAAQNKGILKIFDKGPFKGMNRAFGGAVNTASLEVYKGMVGVNDHLYRSLGNKRATHFITQAFAGFKIEGKTARAQAASVANKLTLRMNSAALGISKGQIQGEAGLLFAPRYYRAFFGLLADSLQGGMRGGEARRSLGQMVASFLAINAALEYVVPGVEGVKLDPRKSGFMTTRVGGINIGPGGPMVSLLNVIGKSVRADREGNFLIKGPFGIGINPGLSKLDINENPVMRWGRGKLSPVASLIVDVLDGQSFMGDNIDNPMDFMNVLADRLTPFFVQAGIDIYTKDLSIKDIGLAAGAEFVAGARTFPVSLFELRNEARDEVAQEIYSKDYSELDDSQKKRVKEDEQVEQAQEKADEEATRRGFEGAQKRDKEADLLQQWVETGQVVDEDGNVIGQGQDSTQGQDNTLFSNGIMSGQNWVTKYQERQKAYFSFRDGIRGTLGISFPGDEDESSPINKALDAYFEIIPKNYLDDENIPIWDDYFAAKDRAREAAISAGRKANGAQGAADVESYLSPIEDDPVVARFKKVSKLRDDLEAIPKYRFVDAEGAELVDRLLKKVRGIVAAAREQGSKINNPKFFRALLKSMPREHKLYEVVAVALMRSSSPSGKLYQQAWNPKRDELVMANPDMVKFYIKLYKNMSEVNKIEFVRRYGTKFFANEFTEEEGLNPF